MGSHIKVCLDRRIRVDGLIVANTSLQRPDSLKSENAIQPGGLSGRPIRDLSTRCISEMYRSKRKKLEKIILEIFYMEIFTG